MLAHRTSTEAARERRLETLAAIWGRLSLLHPMGADGSIDWNQILVKAIPLVERATSAEDLARALNSSVFAPLGDPLAFAQGPRVRAAPPLTEPVNPPRATKLSEHAVSIDLTDPRAPNDPGFLRQLSRSLVGLDKRDTLVLDLRWPADYAGGGPFRGGWWTVLLDSVRSSGPTITREHLGWSRDAPQPNAWYGQGWRVQPAIEMGPVYDQRAAVRELYPPDSIVAAPILATVIVVNNGAIRRYERGLRTLMTQRNIAVVYQRDGIVSEAAKYGFGDSIAVRFHDAVLVDANGALGWRPDVVTDSQIANDTLLAMARHALAVHSAPPTAPRPRFDFGLAAPPVWPAADAPTREERIAGLISLWSVLQRFHPYLDHGSVDFGSELPKWIQRVDSSSTLASYYRTLNELLSRLNDGHARAFHPRLAFRNGNTIPIKVMRIGGKPVVVEVAPSVRSDTFPVHLGDEILAVEGRSAAEVEGFYRPVTSAARDPLGFLWGIDFPFYGPPGSTAELTVRGDGNPRTVRIARVMQPSESFDTVTVRRLPGGIGYINLRATTSGAVLDAAMDDFERTASGVILDLRGYLGALGNLPRRVVDRPPTAPRGVGGVIRLTIDQDLETRAFAQYRAPEFVPDTELRYKKPIVVLIDRRAGSQSESWALAMQTAPNVTFVGDTTAGTTGSVTFLSLPGGGNARFTGERITRFDGTTFHGIGIVPDVRVAPSIAGLRRGRDEVLERAIQVIRQKAPATGLRR